MADWRYFEPAFWRDGYIQRLTFEEKSFYSYLWTNPNCNQAGVFQITTFTMAFETGLEEERIWDLLIKLQKDGKIVYQDDILWIKSYLKHQPNRSIKVWERIKKDLQIVGNHSDKLIKQFWQYNKELVENTDTLSGTVDTLSEKELTADTPVRKGLKEDYKRTSSSCPKLEFTDEDMKLTKCLEAKIQAVDPKHKFSGGQRKEKWANIFRLMRDQDNRTHQDIQSVLDFAFNDTFWCTVVQSAGNLRDNYNKIRAKMLKTKKMSKEDTKYQAILSKAKQDLGKLAGKERILGWLVKLPERFHGEIARYLDRTYRGGHSYGEAKDEWERAE